MRVGVVLDPELVSWGTHVTFGPIFTPRLLRRSTVAVADGELTTLLAVNLEGIYRLMWAMPRNR